MSDHPLDLARAAFLAAWHTLCNERRDFPEWHLGRPHYALWAVDVDLPDVRHAVAGAEAHLDGDVEAEVQLGRCGFADRISCLSRQP